MKPPRLTDTTLRDGSHAMRHQFTRQQVRSVVEALDKAGVPVLEVTHGDGLAGSSIQYGFSRTNEMDLIEEARNATTRSRGAQLTVLPVDRRGRVDPDDVFRSNHPIRLPATRLRRAA